MSTRSVGDFLNQLLAKRNLLSAVLRRGLARFDEYLNLEAFLRNNDDDGYGASCEGVQFQVNSPLASDL